MREIKHLPTAPTDVVRELRLARRLAGSSVTAGASDQVTNVLLTQTTYY